MTALPPVEALRRLRGMINDAIGCRGISYVDVLDVIDGSLAYVSRTGPEAPGHAVEAERDRLREALIGLVLWTDAISGRAHVCGLDGPHDDACERVGVVLGMHE